MNNILVTGCAGFIGSNFAHAFKAHFPEYQLVGLDDFSSGKQENLPQDLVFFRGSISDAHITEKIFSEYRPEYIFHFAAMPRVAFSIEHPDITADVNTGGTIRLLKLAHQYGAKRFIFSSSAAVYGNAQGKVSENDKTNPLSPYAEQKRSSETYCKLFSSLYGLDTVSLRYFNVFGPRQDGSSPYSTVIAAWIDGLLGQKQPFLEGDGTQTRDFCYVDNVISANLLAMQCSNNLNGEIINIGTGVETSLIELKTALEKISEKTLVLESRAERIGDIKTSAANIDKAKEILGYMPKISFEEGLRKTFDSRVQACAETFVV